MTERRPIELPHRGGLHPWAAARFLAPLLLLAAIACGPSTSTSDHSVDRLKRGSLSHGGQERSYALYAPSTPAGTGPRPIVLVLHGSGGSADRIRAFTGRRFEHLADEHGFLVAYPEGFEGNWNGCRARNPSSANRRDIDDPGFLRALVTQLHGKQAGGGEPDVLAFGFSGGGHLALRLALEAPDLVDAVVAVGASLPEPSDSDCTPSGRPVAVALIDGTEDPINPYDGGDVVLPEALGGGLLGRVLSAEEAAANLAALAGHDDPPMVRRDPDRDGDPSTAVERRVWRSVSGPEVALITVHGGGHTIPHAPGTEAPFPDFAGPASTEIDAALEAWTLLRRRDETSVSAVPTGTVRPDPL